MEDKELYNPQSGEKIAPKKPKKFWADWRFYIYTILAFFLGIICVSSCVTACAAIDAGVGDGSSEAGNTSLVSSVKKAYYNEDLVSHYGTNGYTFYNYTSYTLYISYGSGSSQVDRNLGAMGTWEFIGANPSSFVIRFLNGIVGNSSFDFYIDGEFSSQFSVDYYAGTSTATVSTEGASSSPYFWLFENSLYDEGYSEGYSEGFDSGAVINHFSGFYNDDVTIYGHPGTENGWIYNYSSLPLRLVGHTSGLPPLDSVLCRGDPMGVSPVPYSSVYRYFHTSLSLSVADSLSNTYKGKLLVDVWRNGVFYKTVQVWYNGASVAPTTVYFSLPSGSDNYFWLFSRSSYSLGYEDGYTDGVATVQGFKSLGCVHPSETFNDFEPYGSASYLFKFFEFVDGNGTEYSVYAVPDNLNGTSVDEIRFVVVMGYDFVWSDRYSIIYTTIGYGSLLDGYYHVTSNSTFTADGCVLGNVYNSAMARGIFKFTSDELNPYTVGYGEGYDLGYNVGYGQGRADGFNEAEPDSLTTTLVTVFQQPFNQIYRFFNFNILGLNVLTLVSGLLTLFIVFKVLKKVKR